MSAPAGIVALLWLSVLWLLLSCVPALAHATLVQETPAAGARVEEPPEQLRLRFSEPVDAEFDPLKVYDAERDRVDEDDARVDPNDARVVVEGLEELPEGSYRVEWRITSVDGHVVSGKYGFSVTGTGNQGARNNGAENGERPAESSGEAPFAVFPRTVVYGAMSVGVLVLLVVSWLLVSRLYRRRKV